MMYLWLILLGCALLLSAFVHAGLRIRIDRPGDAEPWLYFGPMEPEKENAE